MQKKNRLIIFTRFPMPGKTKTRLIPHLGDKGAAELQREMTEYTVRQARQSGADIEVRYTGGSAQQMREWLGDDLNYAEQGDGDLGERMLRALEHAFSNGWKSLKEAFQELNSHHLVIGLAEDGGYYLIGLGRACSPSAPSAEEQFVHARLFEGIEWGGERVFEQTMKAASRLNRSWKIMPWSIRCENEASL